MESGQVEEEKGELVSESTPIEKLTALVNIVNMTGRFKQGRVGLMGMEAAKLARANCLHPRLGKVESANFVEFWLFEKKIIKKIK